MHTKYWLTLLAASMFAFGCSDNTDSSGLNDDDVYDDDENGKDDYGDPDDNAGTDGSGGSGGDGRTGSTGDDDPEDNGTVCKEIKNIVCYEDSDCYFSEPAVDDTSITLPEQSDNMDIDDSSFNESLLEDAPKLSINVLKKYYKSEHDSDYGETIKWYDPTTAKTKITEFVKNEPNSAKWTCKEGGRLWLIDDPSTIQDFTNVRAISFWAYAPEESVGASFFVYLGTGTNKGTLAKSYRARAILEHAGWNYITLKRCAFSKAKDPLGWDKVNKLFFYEDWTNKSHQPFTVYFEGIYLHTDVRDVGLTNTKIKTRLEGALFSMNGSRAIVENQLIKTSFTDDTSIVYKKDDEYWLPLAVFGARYDKDAVYNHKSHILKMKLNNQSFVFQAGKNFALVDGQKKNLDFIAILSVRTENIS